MFVNIIHEWQNLQIKDNFERQNVEGPLVEILLTLRVFATNLLRGSGRRNIFSYFVLLAMC